MQPRNFPFSVSVTKHALVWDNLGGGFTGLDSRSRRVVMSCGRWLESGGQDAAKTAALSPQWLAALLRRWRWRQGWPPGSCRRWHPYGFGNPAMLKSPAFLAVSRCPSSRRWLLRGISAAEFRSKNGDSSKLRVFPLPAFGLYPAGIVFHITPPATRSRAFRRGLGHSADSPSRPGRALPLRRAFAAPPRRRVRAREKSGRGRNDFLFPAYHVE